MDEKSQKFDWNQARGFLMTAQEGSLSAAARKLGLTQPTLSRQVASLEEQLDVVLFERIGRGLSLTPSGLDLLDHFKTMGQAAEKISLAASGKSQVVEGLVSISASDIMSAYLLPNALVALREVAPRIDIELVVANEISDLQKREADIAIRHVRPDQAELIAKHLGDAKGCLYSTPEYLGSLGQLKTPTDIKGATFVSYGNPKELVGYIQAMGIPIELKDVRYNTTDAVSGWELVKSGLGLGVMSCGLGGRTDEVVAVFQDKTTVEYPIWLVTHKELHTSKRIRIVFDFLSEYLQMKPDLTL